MSHKPVEVREFLNGTCPHCNGQFEFPKNAVGVETECPHCKVVITLKFDGDSPAVESPKQKQAEVEMKDFTTSDGEVFGRFAASPSREFLLIWRDEWVGGRSRTKGPFYLFRGTVELCKGFLQRPNDGQVADNGSFVFCDWLFAEKLASAFYAFSCTGEMLIEKKFRANLFNAAISPDGLFAACQTAANPESRHGEILTLFDLRARSEVWHVSPPFWPEAYDFDIPRLELTIRGSSPIYRSCVLSLTVSTGK